MFVFVIFRLSRLITCPTLSVMIMKLKNTLIETVSIQVNRRNTIAWYSYRFLYEVGL